MIEPQFKYISDNLNRILQNPGSVLYLEPDNVGRKKALFAMIRESEGVYKKIQITEEQSNWTFPFEPIYCFYKGAGHLFLKNFISFYNIRALNISNLDGFKYEKYDDRKVNIYIYATFCDGTAAFVKRLPEKQFLKECGIEAYINLIREHKEYNPQYKTYEIIDSYNDGSNTFIIPQLQVKKEEQQKIKKLTKSNKI